MQRMDDRVSVELRRKQAHRRVNGSDKMPASLHVAQAEISQPDSPFPFLEVALNKAKESPWIVLSIIVGVAAIIVGAIVSFTVGFGLFLFSLNGTMHEMKAQQTVIVEQLNENKNDLKVLRTYEASVLSRQNYAVGLMDRKGRDAMNEYDRANPLPRIPEKSVNKE